MTIEELQNKITKVEEKIQTILNEANFPEGLDIGLEMIRDDEGFFVAIVVGIGSKEEDEPPIPFKHRRN